MSREQNRTANIVTILDDLDSVQKRVELLRQEAGVSRVFKTLDRYKAFQSRLAKDPKKSAKFNNARQRFKDFASDALNKEGLAVGYSGLHAVLDEYFGLGKVRKETIASADVTGCAIERVSDENSRGLLSEGIYIRLGLDTSIGELRNFINKNGKLIEQHQKSTRFQQRGTQRRRKLQPRTSKLNQRIRELSLLPTTELREKAGTTTRPMYKDSLITAILHSEGFNCGIYTVSTYLKRNRKRAQGGQ